VPHEARFAEQKQVDRDTWTRAGDAGLLCISIPEEYGGGGGTFAHEAVLLQEQGFVGDTSWGNSVHSTINAHYINAYLWRHERDHEGAHRSGPVKPGPGADEASGADGASGACWAPSVCPLKTGSARVWED
jgi:alkylation response protein AidB-like acyl-CoA dehydrogenase